MKRLYIIFIFLFSVATSAEIIKFDLGTISGLYDTDKKCSLLVECAVSENDILSNYGRRSFYRTDTRTASPYLFIFSGYIRGHLISSETKGDKTFNMFNIAPQDAKLNCGLYKEIEMFERKEILKGSVVRIKCGAIFLKNSPERWIKGSIQIPDAFFKVLYDRNNKATHAWYLENKPITKANPDNYTISIERLKELTGMNL
jgi:DNA/RNA endonuclease G (NUC1)